LLIFQVPQSFSHKWQCQALPENTATTMLHSMDGRAIEHEVEFFPYGKTQTLFSIQLSQQTIPKVAR
jgi:hypothetical protein